MLLLLSINTYYLLLNSLLLIDQRLIFLFFSPFFFFPGVSFLQSITLNYWNPPITLPGDKPSRYDEFCDYHVLEIGCLLWDCRFKDDIMFSKWQLLGDILLDRSNSAVMTRYVSSRDNLRILMNLLRVWSISTASFVLRVIENLWCYVEFNILTCFIDQKKEAWMTFNDQRKDVPSVIWIFVLNGGFCTFQESSKSIQIEAFHVFKVQYKILWLSTQCES